MSEPGTFDTTKNAAANVAHMVWEYDQAKHGPATVNDIWLESMDEDSEVSFMTKEDVSEAMSALRRFGLISSHSRFDATTDHYAKEDEVGQPMMLADTSHLGPLMYDVGGEKELRDPDTVFDGSISDPVRAFQRIGQMQQEYEFTREWYTDFLADYSPEY